MAQALRSTTNVRRPVDMFFLPAEEVDVQDESKGADALSEAPTNSKTAAEPIAGETEQESRADSASTPQDRDSASTPQDRDSASTPQNRDSASTRDEGGPGKTHEDATTDVSRETPDQHVETGVEPSPASPGETPQAADLTSAERRRERENADDSAQHGEPAHHDAPDTVDASAASSDHTTDAPDGGNDEELTAVPGARFAEIPVRDIHPNRKQPRQVFDEDELEELAFSVRELGVLQPVVVRPSREGGSEQYELVMGERRWRAVQRAGLEAVPAIIRETTDDDLLRDALLENLHRSQLNPLEEAAAYQQLMEEFGATQEELSRRIGRSRPQISNTLRLLRLPALVQRRVAAGVLSSGHARALLGLTDPAEMERLAQRIIAEGMSVRATEEAVALHDGMTKRPTKRKSTAGRHDDRLNYIADAFSDKLDTSVKIQLGARKGKMTIEFASVEDLNRIIDVLDPRMES